MAFMDDMIVDSGERCKSDYTEGFSVLFRGAGQLTKGPRKTGISCLPEAVTIRSWMIEVREDTLP
jgi:hypothetical protein